MKKVIFSLICMLLSIAISNSSVYSANFIYDIDEFTANNGTNTFIDSFSDGFEPPSSPIAGTNYNTGGTFASNRESGGLLELNSADTAFFDDQFVIVGMVDNSSYFFSSGNGGYLSAAFQINDGLFVNSGFAVLIDNVDYPGPEPTYFEDAWAGISVDPTGNIYAIWGNSTWDSSMVEFNNDFSMDITAGFGTNNKVTIEVLLNGSNNDLTARWDYGSDGTWDLTDTNYGDIDLTHGSYNGGFAAFTVVPEPISSILFLVGGATLGFRRFRKTITN